MYILPSKDKFNKIFQKSTENTTCQLYSEMSRLVCLYSSNLLKADVIKAAKDNLSTLSLSMSGQLSDKNLGVVENTWALIAQMDGEHDIKPFYTAVHNFCVATIQRILKTFPFGDSLIWGLLILNLHVLTNSAQ